jgi:hypothetical protein
MTVVVADSSPLNYLVLIGSIDLLRGLYGRILVPPQVVVELTDPPPPSAFERRYRMSSNMCEGARGSRSSTGASPHFESSHQRL